MAVTIGTPITASFTKYGAYTKKAEQFSGFDDFIAGSGTISTGANTYENIVFLYGLNFEELRQHLNNNLKITGVTIQVTGGRYNSTALLAKQSVLSFRVVQGFPTDKSSTETGTYTDILGDNIVTVTEGSIAPTTVTTFTHEDISPNFLSWLNNNLEDFLNGYTTNSFGFRFYFMYAQLRAFTMNVNYTYGYNEYEITTGVTPAGGGTVTGGGTHNEGSTAILKATPNDGYKFVKWSDGNTSNPRTVTVSADITYTAIFELDKINKIYIGTSQPKEIYVGTTPAKAVYVGTMKIYG